MSSVMRVMDLTVELPWLLRETAQTVAASPPRTARDAVRRRLVRLRRRRKLRTTLSSSTLAAGLFAGAHQLPNSGGRSDPTAPTAEVVPHVPDAPAEPGGHSWTWDPETGRDLVAADPAGVFAGGRFHVYTTSAGGLRVPRFGRPDLAAGPGQLEGDAMPQRPAWVAPGDDAIWAPAVAPIGGGYVLYFAATSGRQADGGLKCLGAAVAATPEGPFVPRPEPLLCSEGSWNIDPSPVADGNRWHLLWRQDDARHITGRIVTAELRPDGLALADPRAEPTTLLVGEYPWEEGYPEGTPGIGPIENPAMARHPVTGDWLLTWSANRWETQAYATGLAVCSGPSGPCTRISRSSPWVRTSDDPTVSTTANFGGAGGSSFVTGPDGQLYAVLHAYPGEGRHPDAGRAGWVFRVDADTSGGHRYKLVEIGWNHPAQASVMGS